MHLGIARLNTLYVSRHLLSGSYNNNFHIYDREGQTDVVLQADKSAFKAKKVGAQKSKAGAAGKNQGKGANGVRSPVDIDNIDFNKKILHASWHPKEDTIAIAATNNLFLFAKSSPQSSQNSTTGSGP
ncbi:protein phosphatase 2A regulatory subunit cdc55 [Cystobasidiomycetes sp. EMM_F5]